MINKKIDVIMIKQILYLKNKGKNKTEVASILKINRETVRKYWSYDSNSNQDTNINNKNHESESNLLNNKTPQWVQSIQWDNVLEQIKSGVPKNVLYEELKINNYLPTYSNFCRYLNLINKRTTSQVTIRIDRHPGRSVEVDYSGDTFPIINPATSEIINCHLFVGVLSYSSYTYAEFTFSEKLEDFIQAHNGMFFYFEGVPKYLIPDNCKTAVIKANRYDPELNCTYKDLSVHYGIIVDPARPGHPKDKPRVERAVGIIQSDFFYRVRNKTFTSLRELNKALSDYLYELNRRIIRERGKSRWELFEEEKKFLSTLPNSPYEIFYFKRAKLHSDCHVQHNRNFYSAPYAYIGKNITIKYNSKILYLYTDSDLIATHTVKTGHCHYSTNEAHYPERKIVDLHISILSCKNDAQKIGTNTSSLIDKIFNLAKHPLKNLKKAQGIIKLSKLFSKESIEFAAEAAITYEQFTYAYIKSCAQNYKQTKIYTSKSAPTRDLRLVCLQGEK